MTILRSSTWHSSASSGWTRRKSSFSPLLPSYFWLPIGSIEDDLLEPTATTETALNLCSLSKEAGHEQDPEKTVETPCRSSQPILFESCGGESTNFDSLLFDMVHQAECPTRTSCNLLGEWHSKHSKADLTEASSDTQIQQSSEHLLSLGELGKRPRDQADIKVKSQSPLKSCKPCERAELPQVARRGQAHWLTSRDELRRRWEEREFGEWEWRFRQQLKMCSRGHIRSQHECLLRSLHMAVVDGLILPDAFDGDDEWERSFLGWTGFKVVQEHAVEFRRRIAELFERPPTDSTLNNCLRRAGFGPSALCWDQAWSGLAAFAYDGKRRARYTRGAEDGEA